MLKLKIPANFAEEPYSIGALVICDGIAWVGHKQFAFYAQESSLFLFFMACCSWLTVGALCKLILKYGFN